MIKSETVIVVDLIISNSKIIIAVGEHGNFHHHNQPG